MRGKMRTLMPVGLVALLGVVPRASALEIGEPFPSLQQLGVTSFVRAPDVPEPTHELLIIGASWCPLTRAVLSREDSLAARGEIGSDVHLVAVLTGPMGGAGDIVGRAPWPSFDLVLDEAGRVRAASLDAVGESTIPYAFISEVAGDERRLLWHGPVVAREAEDPLGIFDAALRDIETKRFDVDAERALRAEIRRAQELRDALVGVDARIVSSAAPAWSARLDEIAALSPRAMAAGRLVDSLNGFAWDVATREGAGGVDLALAKRAIDLAMAHGGATEAAVVDTDARVRHELGDHEGALEAERRAVRLARGTPLESSLRETLALYAAALGAEPAAEGEEPAPAVPEHDAPWRGSLNEAWGTAPPAAVVLVRPSSERVDARTDSTFAVRLGRMAAKVFPGARVVTPDEVTEAMRGSGLLALYGSPDTNPLLAEALAARSVALDTSGLAVGELAVEMAAPVLIAAFASPWAPERPVVVYAASDAADAADANRFFHGPTNVVVGRWTETREAEVVHAFDAFVDASGVLVPAIGPERITGLEAREDLLALHDALREDYAGYGDIGWRLEAAGSSWAARTREAAESLAARDEWTWDELFDALADYLSPVNDTHFEMWGQARRAGGLVERLSRFVDSRVAHFTDLRVVRRGDTYVITRAAPPDSVQVAYGDVDPHALVGMTIDVTPVPGPYDVERLVPYAFPTFPAGEFLVGVFTADREPPGRIPVGVTNGDSGASSGLLLPVHRARVHRDLGAGGAPWALVEPPAVPLPVLEVRTMSTRRLEAMPAAAARLSSHDAFVLDLRSNGGGSDLPGMRFCAGLSDQPFRGMSAAHLAGGGSPFTRWESTLDGVMNVTGATEPRGRYEGRVYVLTDKDVYSSGETFAVFASQLDGAKLVGEDTAGCARYGNVESHGPLPNSGIRLRFGRTRFLMDGIRENAEGIGLFPDVWLDVDDVMPVLAEMRVAGQ